MLEFFLSLMQLQQGELCLLSGFRKFVIASGELFFQLFKGRIIGRLRGFGVFPGCLKFLLERPDGAGFGLISRSHLLQFFLHLLQLKPGELRFFASLL